MPRHPVAPVLALLLVTSVATGSLAACSGLPAAPGTDANALSGPADTATGIAPSPSGGSGSTSARPSVSGSSAASATSRSPASTAVTTSGSAGAALASPPLPAVKGYAYATAPKAVIAAMQPLAAKYAGIFSAPTVRSVVKAGSTVCTAAAMRLNPDYVGTPAIENGLLNGLVQGLGGKGYKLSNRTVAGQPVVVAAGKTSTVVAWYRSGVVVLLVGTEPAATLQAFAAAYLKR